MTNLIDKMVTAWETAHERAGYGSFAGSGVRQQAAHIVDRLIWVDPDQDHTHLTTLFLGFLGTSLGDTWDLYELAEELADEVRALVNA